MKKSKQSTENGFRRPEFVLLKICASIWELNLFSTILKTWTSLEKTFPFTKYAIIDRIDFSLYKCSQVLRLSTIFFCEFKTFQFRKVFHPPQKSIFQLFCVKSLAAIWAFYVVRLWKLYNIHRDSNTQFPQLSLKFNFLLWN